MCRPTGGRVCAARWTGESRLTDGRMGVVRQVDALVPSDSRMGAVRQVDGVVPSGNGTPPSDAVLLYHAQRLKKK